MTINEMRQKYEMTIGIECHVQLATDTKLFSGADNDARDKSPNSVVSPNDYALPGMLPVLNRRAIDLSIRAGKALNAPIARVSRFDRKHYFYPDLPKGYQTTQMYHPIILAGQIDAPLDDGTSVPVRIHHAHLEEDAGKLTHYGDYSLVDLNRAGTPLIEIVSEPDIHSAAAARAYAAELHRLMTYAGVTRGDLYHGNMRFDVNLSVALHGASELGTRAEVKNLNSFRSIEKAAEYEFHRQVTLLEKGESIVQETRGWDEASQTTSSQRSKEDAQDYRYMPDADIPPVVLSDAEVEQIQSQVPMLPPEYRQKWQSLQVDRSVTDSLLSVQAYAELVTQVQSQAGDDVAKRVANWFASALGGHEDAAVAITLPSAPDLITLAKMTSASQLSSTAAKEIFVDLTKGDTDVQAIATRKNLLQVSDEGAIIAVVEKVLADPASAKAVADIRAGNDKVIGFLVGQVMKLSQGKANPALAQKLLRERI